MLVPANPANPLRIHDSTYVFTYTYCDGLFTPNSQSQVRRLAENFILIIKVLFEKKVRVVKQSDLYF